MRGNHRETMKNNWYCVSASLSISRAVRVGKSTLVKRLLREVPG